MVASSAKTVVEEEEHGVDDEPIATLATRQGIHHAPSIPLHIDSYHPHVPSMMPHQTQTGMMLKLNINNAMSFLHSFLPYARGKLNALSIV
jgi:hypothetical protein